MHYNNNNNNRRKKDDLMEELCKEVSDGKIGDESDLVGDTCGQDG